jgi:hypothetical protein
MLLVSLAENQTQDESMRVIRMELPEWFSRKIKF